MIILFLTLLPIAHTANIFCGAYFSGSHLTAIYEVALVLAEAGHNITFVNLVSVELEKQPKHPNIHGLDIAVWNKEDKKRLTNLCVKGAVTAKTGELPESELFKGCMDIWAKIWERSISTFSGDQMRKVFETTQFDVILGESVEINGMALLGTLTKVPVINFQAAFGIHLSQKHGNLPMLLSSQPSFIYAEGFDKSPPLMYRLSRLPLIYKLLPFIQSGSNAMQPFLEKNGFSSLDDVKDSIKLFLTNDHPAFTFPYLRPPNDIPVGCSNLLGSKKEPLKLSTKIEEFLEKSIGKDVVYVSFGSYVKMRFVSWFAELIDILAKQDLRIIVKVDEQDILSFPESVLPLSWAPQKDLLRSGQLKLFISHCGNNGRLETMYYNVPVLCIPQFGDQQVNSEIIKHNGFGEFILKEDVLEKADGLVRDMLTNYETYHKKLEMASDIVDNEPGNVKENLIFYVEYVAKHKNADYLVNKVIQQQSLVQIYNLDIILPVCIILLLLFGLALYVLLKCLVFLKNRVFMKRPKLD